MLVLAYSHSLLFLLLFYLLRVWEFLYLCIYPVTTRTIYCLVHSIFGVRYISYTCIRCAYFVLIYIYFFSSPTATTTKKKKALLCVDFASSLSILSFFLFVCSFFADPHKTVYEYACTFVSQKQERRGKQLCVCIAVSLALFITSFFFHIKKKKGIADSDGEPRFLPRPDNVRATRATAAGYTGLPRWSRAADSVAARQWRWPAAPPQRATASPAATSASARLPSCGRCSAS